MSTDDGLGGEGGPPEEARTEPLTALEGAASLAGGEASITSMAIAEGATRGQEAPSGQLAFADLYASQYAPLVRLAFVLTGEKEAAEDIVQDCFVRLHRHFHRLESPDRYLRQAVVNACRSHFRRLGRERDRRPMLYLLEGAQQAAGGLNQGELHDVLVRLPYRQRAAIVLRFYGDLSETEIARLLGCRPGTVGSLIHRGLERLRSALER